MSIVRLRSVIILLFRILLFQELFNTTPITRMNPKMDLKLCFFSNVSFVSSAEVSFKEVVFEGIRDVPFVSSAEASFEDVVLEGVRDVDLDEERDRVLVDFDGVILTFPRAFLPKI